MKKEYWTTIMIRFVTDEDANTVAARLADEIEVSMTTMYGINRVDVMDTVENTDTEEDR